MVLAVDDTGSDPFEGIVWEIDPHRAALEASRGRRMHEPPGERFCTEVGRQLLRAQFQFSDWVLRRVEKVRFDHDRRVSRDISIDLRVPEFAPRVEFEGQRHWLVPISVMRRRTLVNLDLRDEEERAISMLGLRFTQRLDEAVLRAAARLSVQDRSLPPELEDLIRKTISGDWHTVTEVGKAIEPAKEGALGVYLRAPLFRAAFDRLRHNFTLYVLLRECDRRHRLLHMAFDEPVDWYYQKPTLKACGSGPDRGYIYRPLADKKWRMGNKKASLALAPTPIRFLTPSAENCASYHFEFTAPLGVRISRATLLAGRPNENEVDHPRFTLDDLDGRSPTIGLHGVEIPNGSLSRVQVELQIPAQGWLSTLFVACVAAWFSILFVWVHTLGGEPPSWGADQITNVVVLLVGVTAGAATYVAHHQATEVATRMVTGLRMIGALAIGLPAIVAAWLVLLLGAAANQDDLAAHWFWVTVCFVLATGCCVLVGMSWRSARNDHRREPRISAWDMSNPPGNSVPPPRLGDRTYMRLVHEYGFDERALGVHSAEGWHEVFRWTDESQRQAELALSKTGNATACSCSGIHAGSSSAKRTSMHHG